MYVCLCVVYIHMCCTWIVDVNIGNMHINALHAYMTSIYVILSLLSLQNPALKN